jgi:general secretion pathway protein A
MYECFYGLQERPFSLTSNPRFLLLTPTHKEALSTLEYGLGSRCGIIVLTGEAGTGKTTVIRAALASQGDGSRFVVLNNPLVTGKEFAAHVARGFGLSDPRAGSKTAFLEELTRTLEDTAQAGLQAGLIVDEAHLLPLEILEEIRLLANIETDDHKLLPVVLAGQPELRDRLNEPGLRQLKQRIVLRCVLELLTRSETAAYIAGRIRVAGGDPAQLFSAEGVELIHAYSQGLPRVVNVICENALVTGFAASERPVAPQTIVEVCRDLDLEAPGLAHEGSGSPPPKPTDPNVRTGESAFASFRRFLSRPASRSTLSVVARD